MEQRTLLVLGASSEVGRKLIESVYEDYGLIYAHYAHSDGRFKELNNRIGGKLHLIQDDFSSSLVIKKLSGNVAKTRNGQQRYKRL